jgi:ATP-binding protein involved in chromosome partitioning
MGAFEKINLPDIKNIITVASGKGGVGKSTVSANLAIALAGNGYSVALVDADIFGPSIPKMFGIEDAMPEVFEEGEKQLMKPIEKYGVKVMSIGFFVKQNQGLIWRGPMASNALTQLLENTQWGETDYMIIDFPPGTSDIQLTAVQKLTLAGALIVTTPQEIALNDARKAASLFSNDNLKVPILGVIENMSWFTPKPHPEEKYYIFGQGGGERLANELNVPLIGQIPLIAEVGEAAEKGLSVFSQGDKTAVEAFDRIVSELFVKA